MNNYNDSGYIGTKIRTLMASLDGGEEEYSQPKCIPIEVLHLYKHHMCTTRDPLTKPNIYLQKD